MPADIDVLVGSSSPINFTPRYAFKSQIHDCDVSSNILNSKISNSVCHSTSNHLNFSSPLSCSANSSSYLGQSPSIFDSNSPTHFTFHSRCTSPTLRSFPTFPITLARNLNQLQLNCINKQQMPVAVPRRPCLVVRCDVLDIPSSHKNKKKVVFADDKGYPLTLVRTMTEPSNMPPQLGFNFLAGSTGYTSNIESIEPWEVSFPQPASDYLDFRRRLDMNYVSLENVIIKENQQLLLGTVKVRNLVYQKEVFVRSTADNWKTQEDAFCIYVPNSPPPHGVTILYDTFSFRLTLPPKSKKMEFCVCFRCSGAEYWDNNSGKNYFILRKEPPIQGSIDRPSLVQFNSIQSNLGNLSNRKINLPLKLSDDVKPDTQLESWSEFASWNHLYNDTPYW